MVSAQGIWSRPPFHHTSTILGCIEAEWQPGRKALLRSPRRQEQSPILERTIVEKFSEPMAMDTYTGLRLRAAVIPPLTAILWTWLPASLTKATRQKECSSMRVVIFCDMEGITCIV